MEAIKKIAEYVAQLRRVGKGHGTISFLFSSAELFVVVEFIEPFFEMTLLDVHI